MTTEYKCADCGCEINTGEFNTFGVCDNCFQDNYRKRIPEPECEKPITADRVEKETQVEMWEDVFLIVDDPRRVHGNDDETTAKLSAKFTLIRQ